MTNVAFPGDDFERIRRQMEALANPPILKMIREVSETAQKLARPPGLTGLREAAERSNAMATPEVLNLIERTNLALSRAVEPSVFRLAEKMRSEMHQLVTPELVRRMAEINANLVREKGDELREYARRVGESVVDPSSRPPEPPAEIEHAIEEEFGNLALTPAETSLLFWLFASYASILCAIGSALNEEVARGFATGLGLMTIFIAVRQKFES